MILRVDPELLLSLGKRDGITTDGAPVPADARVIHRMIDRRGDLLLLVESAEFYPTPEGEPIPEMLGIFFRDPRPDQGT